MKFPSLLHRRKQSYKQHGSGKDLFTDGASDAAVPASLVQGTCQNKVLVIQPVNDDIAEVGNKSIMDGNKSLMDERLIKEYFSPEDNPNDENPNNETTKNVPNNDMESSSGFSLKSSSVKEMQAMTPPSNAVKVIAPPGKLGISLGILPGVQGAVVMDVDMHCPFRKDIEPGNRLLSIDGECIVTSPLSTISETLARKSHSDRLLVFLSDTTTSGDNPMITGRLYTVSAPPGKLGCALEENMSGLGVFVSYVSENCAFREEVQPGDALLSIDEEDVRDVSLLEIVQILSENAHSDRTLVFRAVSAGSRDDAKSSEEAEITNSDSRSNVETFSHLTSLGPTPSEAQNNPNETSSHVMYITQVNDTRNFLYPSVHNEMESKQDMQVNDAGNDDSVHSSSPSKMPSKQDSQENHTANVDSLHSSSPAKMPSKQEGIQSPDNSTEQKNRQYYEVLAPPGTLGLMLNEIMPSGNGVSVQAVEDYCSFRDFVSPGDKLINVNEVNVSNTSLPYIAEILSGLSDQHRRLTFTKKTGSPYFQPRLSDTASEKNEKVVLEKSLVLQSDKKFKSQEFSLFEEHFTATPDFSKPEPGNEFIYQDEKEVISDKDHKGPVTQNKNTEQQNTAGISFMPDIQQLEITPDASCKNTRDDANKIAKHKKHEYEHEHKHERKHKHKHKKKTSSSTSEKQSTEPRATMAKIPDPLLQHNDLKTTSYHSSVVPGRDRQSYRVVENHSLELKRLAKISNTLKEIPHQSTENKYIKNTKKDCLVVPEKGGKSLGISEKQSRVLSGNRLPNYIHHESAVKNDLSAAVPHRDDKQYRNSSGDKHHTSHSLPSDTHSRVHKQDLGNTISEIHMIRHYDKPTRRLPSSSVDRSKEDRSSTEIKVLNKLPEDKLKSTQKSPSVDEKSSMNRVDRQSKVTSSSGDHSKENKKYEGGTRKDVCNKVARVKEDFSAKVSHSTAHKPDQSKNRTSLSDNTTSPEATSTAIKNKAVETTACSSKYRKKNITTNSSDDILHYFARKSEEIDNYHPVRLRTSKNAGRNHKPMFLLDETLEHGNNYKHLWS